MKRVEVKRVWVHATPTENLTGRVAAVELQQQLARANLNRVVHKGDAVWVDGADFGSLHEKLRYRATS